MDYTGIFNSVPDPKGGSIKIEPFSIRYKELLYNAPSTSQRIDQHLEDIVTSLADASGIKWNGTAVPVDYSLRMTSKGWKAYDVKIEGVSYVQNYRNQFNSEISANGLDGVIERLEAYQPETDTEDAQTADAAGGTEA